MLNKQPQVGEEVTLLAYVNTVRDDFELSPGDTGTIRSIEANLIRVDVVYSNARSNNPMGLEHEDFFYVEMDEIEDYLQDFVWAEDE